MKNVIYHARQGLKLRIAASVDGTELNGFLAYPENIRYGVKISAGNAGEL